MREIPEDILRAAKRAYMTYPKEGEHEWMPMARALLAEREAERERCAVLAASMFKNPRSARK